VARHRSATQSSRRDNNSLARFSVDGNNATCSQTKVNLKNSYWTIYFNKTRVISQLRINTSKLMIYIGKVYGGCRSIRPMVDPPRVDPPHVGRSAPRSGSIRPKNYGSFRPIKCVVPPHLEACIVGRTPCEVRIRLNMIRLKIKIFECGL